ncbi:MAG TPA: asparagine synthase (glutamine-hydrolyzing) [Hanamia sp.]|nr:asparagine synthase (glutamine-hydrolyzing) [Hanamia sp.]
MCGIAGFIDFKHSSSLQILKDCTDVLSHRGPDGSGYEFFQNEKYQIGLGHRRLSIIDLSDAGTQPMWYKNFCIVFNGEIYNYEEIKSKLIKLGHKFISHSDTEVILHAWEQWKEKMIQQFVGMFAFVIYDKDKKELFCLRDRAGVKPFYYYWHNGLFLFASELKSFHKHPGFKKEINRQAVYQFMQYGFIMAPFSIFKDTCKLLQGHFLEFNIQHSTFKIKKYWDVYDAYNKPKLDITFSEAKENTKQLLISSCKYRMVADVPVGVFLSGGYDSTVITALLQAHQEEKLKTFTVGFYEETHNEAKYAKKVAKHLGTDHTEYYCTTKEAQEIIPEIPFFCDEPFGDSSIIPTTLVSRLARKEVAVALSADAGDEVFGGYKKYSIALDFIKKINRLPLKNTAGKLLRHIPDSLLNQFTKSDAVSIKKKRVSDLLQHSNITSPLILDHLLSQSYSNEQMQFLFAENIISPESFFNSENCFNNYPGDLHKMMAIDYKTYLPDDILVKIDRAGMSVSLEGREPLLDHRLIEFVAQLPEKFKIKNGDKKYLLKQIVYDYVPKELVDRPKMGFGVPVFDWLRNELKYYVDEYMSKKDFETHGLFKKAGVEIIMKNFFNGNKNYDSLFWYLLMFQMWYKKWMN